MAFLLLCFAALAAAQPVSQGTQAFSAIRTLEASGALHPDDATIQAELALNYFVLDQRQLFHEAIVKALKVDPNCAQAHYLAGRFALETVGNPQAAIQEFQKALELAHSSFKAHYYVGICLRDLGRFEAARDEFQKATGSATYSWPFRALAETELDLGAPQTALQPALKAVELEPESADNFLIAGKVYQALGQPEKAIPMLQEAANLDSFWDTPHFLLGKLYSARAETRARGAEEMDLFQRLRSEDTPAGRMDVSDAERPKANPQAKFSAELDAFGLVVLAPNPVAVIREGEGFLSRFPASEFREKVLELEFDAFRQRNDYAAVRRVGSEILKLNRWNASVLASSALLIANQKDSSADALADEYAARAIEAAKATERPARLTRSEFMRWKDNVLASAYAAKGVLALRRSQSAAAIAGLNEAIHLRPSPNGVDYLRLGEALVLNADTGGAREAFIRAELLGPDAVTEAAKRQAATIETQNAAAISAEFERARIFERQGKLDDAAAAYERVLQEAPNLAEALHNLGLTYYRLRKYRRSRDCLARALQLKPDLAGSRLFLGLSEFRLGDFQDSSVQLESTIRSEPRNREAYLFLLRDQIALDQFHREAATAALRLFPGDPEINYAVGLACLDRIREIARTANDLGPDSVSFVWLSLRRAEERGDTLHAQKYKDRIAGSPAPGLIREYDLLASLLKRSFDVVLAKDPDSPQAHSIKGHLHESHGEMEDALREYREARDHFGAGRLLAQNVRLKEAKREFQKAIIADPQNNRAQADLARLYLQEHEPENAIAILREIVKRYPADPYAWADLGKAQELQGDGDTAVQSLRKALALDPSLNQIHYQLAMLYRKQGRETLMHAELQTFQTNNREHR